MRIRIIALSGAMAASMALAGPALATETVPATGSPNPTLVGAPAAAPSEAAFRNTCRARIATLPSTVEGQPAGLVPGSQKGVYVWHEKAGWRVRVTHPQTRTDGRADLIEVRGRITSTRRLTNVQTIRLEDKQRGEWVTVKRPGRKVLEFRFVNGGFIDGVNFAAGCSGRIGFTVWEVTRGADGKVVRTPMPVFVGATPTEVTATSTPALAANAPSGTSRVVILRAPVTALP
jgi:hypothetical protein